MLRAGEVPPESPWAYADVRQQLIASADWGENHPALCYEFGDPNGDQFIPEHVLEAVMQHNRFVAVIWQPYEVTMVSVHHHPERTFAPACRIEGRGTRDWCDVTRFTPRHDNLLFKSLEENVDPRHVLYGLAVALRTPLGHPLGDEEQTLLPNLDPIGRVLIEFPFEEVAEPLPLDTGITALGALANHEYMNTIYGSPKV